VCPISVNQNHKVEHEMTRRAPEREDIVVRSVDDHKKTIRFSVDGRIGAGAFSTVWRCTLDPESQAVSGLRPLQAV